MDPAMLKTILATQDQAYRSALEMFLKTVKDDMREMQTTVNKLTTSLEFSQRELEDMKQESKQHREEKRAYCETIANLREKVDNSEKKIKELEERMNYQEDYNRRNNLQIIGVEERSEGETWEQTAVKVSQLLAEKMQLPDIELERVHRVGQRDSHQHRPIIARFAKFQDREAVMRSVNKLKGTRIYINEDLCPASQNIRKAQIPALKQAKSEGKVAYFRHTKLIIKDRSSTGETPWRNNPANASTPGAPNRQYSEVAGSGMGGGGGVVLAAGRTTLPLDDRVTNSVTTSAVGGSPAGAASKGRGAATTKDTRLRSSRGGKN